MFTYDPPNEGYTQRIPPGTAAFRTHLKERFGFARTEVVRDASRCRKQNSEHCVCRAVDAFTTDLAKGRKLFEWCVTNAERLGIQSVIFNRRVWGFGKWNERPYTGPSPHTDHVHVGLDKWAAKNLTKESIEQEDDMTYEQFRDFLKVFIHEEKIDWGHPAEPEEAQHKTIAHMVRNVLRDIDTLKAKP